MKTLALKPGLIIIFAMVLLIIGGVILVRRQRPEWHQVNSEAKRYQHEHLPSSEWEPKAKLHETDYAIPRNETLAQVATLRYGHQNYYRVVKLFNHIEDERHIAADFKLRLPDISVILAEEGLTKVVSKEVELILCSRAKYDGVVDQLRSFRAQTDGPYVLPDRVKGELLEAADDLQQATEGLKSSRPGVNIPPGSMIGQLEQTMKGMRDLASGENPDPYGYDIDMVQQRYALAITYGIIWAREGFM